MPIGAQVPRLAPQLTGQHAGKRRKFAQPLALGIVANERVLQSGHPRSALTGAHQQHVPDKQPVAGLRALRQPTRYVAASRRQQLWLLQQGLGDKLKVGRCGLGHGLLHAQRHCGLAAE